VSHHS